MAEPLEGRIPEPDSPPPVQPAAPDDLARFSQFVGWITIAAFVFGTLELAAFVLFAQPWIGVAGGLSLLYALGGLWARRMLRAGQLRRAVVLSTAGLLALILVGAPVLPVIYPTLIMLSFVAVALALPYTHGREIRWLILAAWLVGVAVAVVGNLMPPGSLPGWFDQSLRISTGAVALGLAFLLLWQYATRLNDTLAQTRAANRELQDQVTRRTQAEADLAQERNRLRALIDNIPDFIYAKDTASHFTLANRASAASLGLTPEEIVGKTDFELHTPEDAAQFFADEQAVMQSGQPLFDREETIVTEGPKRWWLTTTVPLQDGGKVTGMVGIAREITDRKRAAEQLHQRLAELEAVNRLSKALRTAASMDEMLSVWLDVTLEVMGANGGSIWLHDAATDELRPVLLRGWTTLPGAGPVQPQRPGVGVNGITFTSQQPYTSDDFRTDPHVIDATRDRIPPGGGASVPIPVGDKIIGTFTVTLPPGRPPTPGDVALLTTLAEIAGSAIQRTRYYQQVEQRLGQLSALRAIDQTITASLDLRVTLGVVLEQAVNQLQTAAADVLLFTVATQTLHFALGRGFRGGSHRDLQFHLGETNASRVVLERRLLVAAMGPASSNSQRARMLQDEGFVTYIGAPLIAKGQVLGVLELFQRADFQPDAAWLDFLQSLAGQAAIAIDNARMFDALQQRNQELVVAYDATIEGWSAALDLRDKETEGHSQRVTEMTLQLAETMGFTPEQLVHVRRGALLHDIGKMGIPDGILLKPGPLTAEEWAIMRQHPTFARQLLEPIRFLRPALDIPYSHHEKWDGSGYPQGQSGEQIPLAARVFSIVDMWDALRSDRPYRAAWSAAQVIEHIRRQSGLQLDPAVVDAFLAMPGIGWG